MTAFSPLVCGLGAVFITIVMLTVYLRLCARERMRKREMRY